MAFDFPPRDVATFEYTVTAIGERRMKTNEVCVCVCVCVCGWKWRDGMNARLTRHERETNENSTNQRISGQLSVNTEPTTLAEELKHCHNESE